MAPRSVTVTPKSSTLLASLPDGRRMVYGKNYSITWEEFERMTAAARETAVSVVSYDTTIANRKGTNFTINSATVPTNYKLGGVEEGIQRFDVAILVKVVDQNLALGDVCTWSNYSTVAVTSDRQGTVLAPVASSFAGVALGTVTNGNYCWIQRGGEVTAKVGSNVVVGSPLSIDTTNDGTLRVGQVSESYTLSSTATGGTFTFTYGGQTTATQVFNVAPGALQTAITGLSSVGAGNATVTGSGNLGSATLTITFTGTLANQNLTDATVNGGSLTGGSSTFTKVADGYNDGTIIGTALTAYNSGTANVALRPGAGRPAYRRIQNRRHWFN